MAQQWMGEIMVGVSAYNGDLTQNEISLKNYKPAGGINFKYNSGDLINFRIGFAWGVIGANDKNNKEAGLKSRNLNFKSNILEANVCVEANIFDPEDYTAYPYVFLGVGVFHFDPYSYDKGNKKVNLQPLSTEGQGLIEYPDRKVYSLTQFCIPVGAGFKWVIKKRWELCYELGYRITFTDYLDDVSNTYIDLETLFLRKGQTSVDMSYRRDVPFNQLGEKRGNSSVKDFYLFSGLKIAVKLGKKAGSKKEKKGVNTKTS
jgi:hypothetical protein